MPHDRYCTDRRCNFGSNMPVDEIAPSSPA
jgi:hypothetical protein